MEAPAGHGLWPLRGAWLLLAVIVAATGDEALADRSGAVAATVAGLAWSAWTAALVAMLVPRTTSLTAVRILVPGGLAATIALAATAEDPGLGLLAAPVVAAIAVLLAVAPWTTDAFVDGSSYGSERRLALRTPSMIGATATATWVLVVGAATTGPLLLAAGRVGLGSAATVAGIGVVVVGARAIHQLSERWLVLVPTGMVLHDPMTMPEPQLFLRQTMAHLGPATAAVGGDPDTEDLTAGASGLAVELALDEPVDLLVHQRGVGASTRAVRRVLFTPGRPRALLEAARANRLPVG